MRVPHRQFYCSGDAALSARCTSRRVSGNPSVFSAPRRPTTSHIALFTSQVQAIYQVVNAHDNYDYHHNDLGGHDYHVVDDDIAHKLNNDDDITEGIEANEANESNQVDQRELRVALCRVARLLQIAMERGHEQRHPSRRIDALSS